jgi:type I restriction-modification system DNA methylase subunit
MNTMQRNKVSDYLEQHKQEYLKQNRESARRKVSGTFYTPDSICELIDAIAIQKLLLIFVVVQEIF